MIALSNTLATILGSLGGVAALIAAFVSVQVHRDQVQAANNAQRVDLLHIGQESLKEALLRADDENKRLRQRVDEQEKKIAAQEVELMALHRHVDIVENELKALKVAHKTLEQKTKP